MITTLEFTKLCQEKLPYEEVSLIFNGREWIEVQSMSKINIEAILALNEIRQITALPPVGTKGEDA